MTSLLKVLLLLSLVTLAQAQWEAARRKLKQMDQKIQQNFARDLEEEAVGSWWGWMDDFLQKSGSEVSKLYDEAAGEAEYAAKAFKQAVMDFEPNFTTEFPANLQMIGKSVMAYLVDEIDELKDYIENSIEDEFNHLINGIETNCPDVIDGIKNLFTLNLGKSLEDFENVANGMDSNCFSPIWSVAHNLGLPTGSSNAEESAVGDTWEWEVPGSRDYIGEQFSAGIASAITIAANSFVNDAGKPLYPLPVFAAQGQATLLLGGGNWVKVDDSGNIEEKKIRFEAAVQTQVGICIDMLELVSNCAESGTLIDISPVPDASLTFNKGAPSQQNGFGATLEFGFPIGEMGAIHIGLGWNVNPDGTIPFSGIALSIVPGETEITIKTWATFAQAWPMNFFTFDWPWDQVKVKDAGEGKMKSLLPHMAQKTPSNICMFEFAKEKKQKPTDDDTPNQWAPCKNPDDCTQYNVVAGISDDGMAAWKTETKAIQNCNKWEQCEGFWKKQDGYFWAMDKKAAEKLEPSDDATGTWLKSCSLNNHPSVSDESGCECVGGDGDDGDQGSNGNQCTDKDNNLVGWCYVKDHTKCRAPHNGYSAFWFHNDKWWSEEPCKDMCKCRGADGADDGQIGSTCTFAWDENNKHNVRRKAKAWCYLPYSINVVNCPGAIQSAYNDAEDFVRYWSYEPCKDYTGTGDDNAERENSVAGELPDKEYSVGDEDEDEDNSHVSWPSSPSWNTDDAVTLDPKRLADFRYGSSKSTEAPSGDDSAEIQSESAVAAKTPKKQAPTKQTPKKQTPTKQTPKKQTPNKQPLCKDRTANSDKVTKGTCKIYSCDPSRGPTHCQFQWNGWDTDYVCICNEGYVTSKDGTKCIPCKGGTSNEQSVGDDERMIQSVAAVDTMDNRVILFFAFIGTCATIIQFVDCARKSACPTHDFSPIEDEI